MTIPLPLNPPLDVTPSPLRGMALLDAVMAHVADEVGGADPSTRSSGDWKQTEYAEFNPAQMRDLGISISTEAFSDVVEISPVDALSCGTAYCVAGHACLMVGDSFLLRGHAWWAARVKTSSGERLSIHDRGQELFGLDTTTASLLFNGTNSYSTLVGMVEAIRRDGHLAACDCGECWAEVRCICNEDVL